MMPPRNRLAAFRDAVPVALALALCPLLAQFTPRAAGPLERMRDLIHVERSLHLFVEPTLHRWAAARPPLLHALDLGYIGIHLPVTLGVLAWVWAKRRHAFALARNTLVAAQTLSAVGYALVPTAPPRMLAGLGYSNAVGPADKGFARLLQSPYAAMPSAHTAFALISAGLVFSLARSRAARLAALLYPPAVIFEILATGNHIWLDSLGGAVVAATAFGIARTLQRREQRPAATWQAGAVVPERT